MLPFTTDHSFQTSHKYRDINHNIGVSEEDYKTVPTAINVAYDMVSSTTQQQYHETEDPTYAVISDK